jgi:hypothetical protein
MVPNLLTGIGSGFLFFPGLPHDRFQATFWGYGWPAYLISQVHDRSMEQGQ